MNISLEIAIVAVAYLFGSISSAIITCRLLGLADPRTQGSGNPGATNVLRSGSKTAAIITLLGDILKGAIPVLLAKQLGANPITLSFVMLAAFLGHLYPIFFQFKGGKGVATAFGCLTAFNIWLGILLMITWLTVALVSRYSSLAALITAISAPLYTYWLFPDPYWVIVTVISFFLIVRHYQNIVNLAAGKESKIGKKNNR